MHRRRLILAARILVALALAAATSGTAAEGSRARHARVATPTDTWQSFVLMTNPATGLPSDNVSADRRARAVHVADEHRRVPVEHDRRARPRDHQAQGGARADRAHARHGSRGSRRTSGAASSTTGTTRTPGAKLRIWPDDGSTVYPFLSSVDNGWLAAALMIVKSAVPQLAAQADAILREMDFGFYYDPAAGLIRGGFWDEPPPQCSTPRQLPRPRAERLLHVPPLRRAQHRAADRELHRHRARPDPAPRTTTRCGARSRTRATGRGRR